MRGVLTTALTKGEQTLLLVLCGLSTLVYMPVPVAGTNGRRVACLCILLLSPPLSLLSSSPARFPCSEFATVLRRVCMCISLGRSMSCVCIPTFIPPLCDAHSLCPQLCSDRVGAHTLWRRLVRFAFSCSLPPHPHLVPLLAVCVHWPSSSITPLAFCTR